MSKTVTSSRQRRILTISAVILLVLGAGGTTAALAWRKITAPTATLRIGDQRGGIEALLVASGQLKGAPYRIEWAQMPAASPLLEALSAGALDLGSSGVQPFAFAYSNHAHIRAIVATRIVRPGPGAGRTVAILAPPNSPIRSVADLRGRRIATVKGSSGQDIALQVLERAGVDPRSVRFVYLNNGDAKAALSTGAVDAWATWSPYVAIAVLQDHDRVLADATGLLSKGAGFLVANTGSLQAKKAIIRDFLQRYIRAREWGMAHRDAYAAEVAKETGEPLAVARYSLATGTIYALTPIDAELASEQRAIFERFQRAGVIDRIPALDAGGYDGSFNDLVAGADKAPAQARGAHG